jgi:hypothetical protein
MPDLISGAEPPGFDNEPAMRAECLQPGHCYEARRDLADQGAIHDALLATIEGLRRRIRVANRLLLRIDGEPAARARAILRGAEDIPRDDAA